jgi:hypothetical protein
MVLSCASMLKDGIHRIVINSMNNIMMYLEFKKLNLKCQENNRITGLII